MPGICRTCGEDDATGRMRTCRNCRANMHFWEKRRPAEILERSRKLRKWQRRMHEFAVVKDDDVTLVDHDTLQRRGIMMFKKAKRRAKSNIVQLKIRDRQNHHAHNRERARA